MLPSSGSLVSGSISTKSFPIVPALVAVFRGDRLGGGLTRCREEELPVFG